MNSEGNAPFIVHYTFGWAYWAGCKLKVKYEWRWLCFVREEKNKIGSALFGGWTEYDNDIE